MHVFNFNKTRKISNINILYDRQTGNISDRHVRQKQGETGRTNRRGGEIRKKLTAASTAPSSVSGLTRLLSVVHIHIMLCWAALSSWPSSGRWETSIPTEKTFYFIWLHSTSCPSRYNVRLAHVGSKQVQIFCYWTWVDFWGILLLLQLTVLYFSIWVMWLFTWTPYIFT